MRIVLVVWGEPHVAWAQPKTALCNYVEDALKAAGIADRYRFAPQNCELRSENGTLIETYRSPESLGMGDGARLFLSPKPGVGG